MSRMPGPSRRAILKTSGAAVLLSAVPVPAMASTAPRRAHHAARTVILRFDVQSRAPGPDVTTPPRARS